MFSFNRLPQAWLFLACGYGLSKRAASDGTSAAERFDNAPGKR
jgi:hypothetical protein